MTFADTDPSDERRPTVVVGWDGSAAARLAMATAAHLAQGGRVVAVHAHEALAPHVTARWQELLALDAAQRSAALLDEVSGGSVDGLEDVHVDVRSVEGDPAGALLAVAADVGADAIAVGSRGIGATAAVHGSVSTTLLTRADRPVLVVPPGAVGI
jgi:nucleotide-binding universal stress UspA family protein